MKRSFPRVLSGLIMATAIVADVCFWYAVVVGTGRVGPFPRVTFFDVGEGDAALLELDRGTNILIDSGPDAKIAMALDRALGAARSLDLVVISDPSGEDSGGLAALLERYRIGAIIYAGRDGSSDSAAWSLLRGEIRSRRIPLVTLGRGDKVRYGTSAIEVLSPDLDFAASADRRQADLVLLARTATFRALFEANADATVERSVLAHYGTDAVRADILKVARHGSADASSGEWLRTVAPSLAVIDAGKNKEKLPSQAVIARILASSSSSSPQLFRTDEDGTFAVWRSEGSLKVQKE